MSNRKRRGGKSGTRESEKIFKMKEENEIVSSKFYLQVLVLFKTETQIELCKY